MFGLKNLVNFASASASVDRKMVIFAPYVSTHTRAKLYPEVESFTKMEVG